MAAIGVGSESGAGGGSSESSSTSSGAGAALVTDTGIALVHEGEFIFAAPGSEAEVALAQADSRMAINVHLPVLIEVIGNQDSAEMDRTVDETLRRLRHAVEAHREVV